MHRTRLLPSTQRNCHRAGPERGGEVVAARPDAELPARHLVWRMKGESATLRFMPVRSCKVTVKDMEGVSHTVDVTAATLYEAVALGMAAIRTDEWVTGIAQGLNSVKVRVTNVAVEHEVVLRDFTNWLDRNGGSPREMMERNRIKSILGMRE